MLCRRPSPTSRPARVCGPCCFGATPPRGARTGGGRGRGRPDLPVKRNGGQAPPQRRGTVAAEPAWLVVVAGALVLLLLLLLGAGDLVALLHLPSPETVRAACEHHG